MKVESIMHYFAENISLFFFSTKSIDPHTFSVDKLSIDFDSRKGRTTISNTEQDDIVSWSELEREKSGVLLFRY